MSKSNVETLNFVGRVRDGAGRYKELELPGRDDLPVSIRDWPATVCRGSLNVQIEPDGYPARFVKEFPDKRISNLDSRRFEPEAELDYDVIPNNSLPPTMQLPDRGRPQVWRATLSKKDAGEPLQCWVLRRRHSRMREDTFECVSGVRLRDALDLSNGDLVELAIEGSWKGI